MWVICGPKHGSSATSRDYRVDRICSSDATSITLSRPISTLNTSGTQVMPNATRSGLASIQRVLFFGSERAGRDGACLLQCAADLRECLDVERFYRAWKFLISRHEILRTIFSIGHDRVPVQSVHVRADVPWRWMDWSELIPRELDREYGALVKRDHPQLSADRKRYRRRGDPG